MTDIYNFTVKDIDGNDVKLSQFKNKVLIIVNTASQCGLAPQYKDLEKLYQDYNEQGLVVLGFPCNQFGSQEPGTENEIKTFCETQYAVSFPMFSKVSVNGNDEHPLYHFLKTTLPGLLGSKTIKWNFTKFLIDKNGKPFKRFSPKESPLNMVKDIEGLL